MIDPRVRDIFYTPSNKIGLVDYSYENMEQFKVILSGLLSRHRPNTSASVELSDLNHETKVKVTVGYSSNGKVVWANSKDLQPEKDGSMSNGYMGCIGYDGTYEVKNLTEEEKKVKFIVDIQQIFVEFCEERKLTKDN